jgi:hypothetical protein
MYRMTMLGVYDGIDKNYGDDLGDTSFVINKKTNAWYCRNHPDDLLCNGVAQFSGDDPNSTDLIMEFVIEVDGEWGPYLPCNPKNLSKPLGDWACGFETITPKPPKNWPKQCQAFNPYSGMAYTGAVLKTLTTDIGSCCAAAGPHIFNYYKNGTCVVLSTFEGTTPDPNALLAYAKPAPTPAPVYPPDWPGVCNETGMTPHANIRLSGGTVLATVNNATVGDCCALASKTSKHPPAMWSFTPPSKCEIVEGATGGTDNPGGISGIGNLIETCNCSRVYTTVGRQNLTTTYASQPSFAARFPAGTTFRRMRRMRSCAPCAPCAPFASFFCSPSSSLSGGIWYDTPHKGMCAPGHSPGDGTGCTWRQAAIKRTIKANCMYERVRLFVVAGNSSCFNACPQPANQTSDCYLECYSNTVLRMPKEKIAQPWNRAFSSAAFGGCPEEPHVHPPQ